MDEDEYYQLGRFPTLEEALEACRGVVDRSLREGHTPCMSADDLLGRYKSFGEDPFVRGPPGAEVPCFSAWDYARKQAAKICADSH